MLVSNFKMATVAFLLVKACPCKAKLWTGSLDRFAGSTFFYPSTIRKVPLEKSSIITFLSKLKPSQAKTFYLALSLSLSSSLSNYNDTRVELVSKLKPSQATLFLSSSLSLTTTTPYWNLELTLAKKSIKECTKYKKYEMLGCWSSS